MSNFISTSGGKIVNVDAIAFLTSRTPATESQESAGTQLIVGFSAASAVAQGGMMPLSLVMQGREAIEFLDQLATRGVLVDHLRAKLEAPATSGA